MMGGLPLPAGNDWDVVRSDLGFSKLGEVKIQDCQDCLRASLSAKFW
jgi:hypothetical protein